MQSKIDEALANSPPLINHQQTIGVIVKHDTQKVPTIHIQNSSHLNVPHHHHQRHQQSRQLSPTPSHYPNATIVQNKPKVSSPAPSHIYGRPSGTPNVSTIPVSRTQEQQQLPQQLPQQSPQQLPQPVHIVKKSNVDTTFNSTQHYSHGPQPPPAHSSRSIYEAPRIATIKQQQQQQLQLPLPLTTHKCVSAPKNVPRPLVRSPGIRVPPSNQTTSDALIFQTQPLDLGVSDRTRANSSSPKRKNIPIQHPTSLAIKYKRVRTPPTIITEQTTSDALYQQTQPVIIRIQTSEEELTQQQQQIPVRRSGGELSPSLTVASSNDSCSSYNYNNNNNNNVNSCSANNENKTTTQGTSVQTTSVQSINQLRTSSADGFVRVSSENSSPWPSPNSTPAKLQSEPEKSSSPGKHQLNQFRQHKFRPNYLR